MTLVSSGDLFLGGDAEPDNRSIQFEAEGSKAGAYSLVEAAAAAGNCVGALPVNMTDFYDWENEVPAVPTSCIGQEAPLDPGIIEVFWSAANSPQGDNVRVQYTRDEGLIYWLPVGGQEEALLVGGSSFPNAVPAGDYKCRVWSQNCTGNSSYRESARFEIVA